MSNETYTNSTGERPSNSNTNTNSALTKEDDCDQTPIASNPRCSSSSMNTGSMNRNSNTVSSNGGTMIPDDFNGLPEPPVLVSAAQSGTSQRGKEYPTGNTTDTNDATTDANDTSNDPNAVLLLGRLELDETNESSTTAATAIATAIVASTVEMDKTTRATVPPLTQPGRWMVRSTTGNNTNNSSTDDTDVTESHRMTAGIPHAAMALILLRKFIVKTRPLIPTAYGGTHRRSLWSYLVSSSSHQQTAAHDIAFGPYRTLLDHVYGHDDEDIDDEDMTEDHHHHDISQSTDGGDAAATDAAAADGDGRAPDEWVASNSTTTTTTPTISTTTTTSTTATTATDTAAQQRAASGALAAFVDLVSVWGHASSGSGGTTTTTALATKDKSGQAVFATLLVAVLDTAGSLAAHGCFNGVTVAFGPPPTMTAAAAATPDTNGVVASSSSMLESLEYHGVAEILASSVFNADVSSSERVELAALKFLLGTGCRHEPTLLRGSYLLQSIRTLYHVFLTTEYKSNKVAARAALQQVVTSVFANVVRTSSSLAAAAATATGVGSPTNEMDLYHHHHHPTSPSSSSSKQDVFPTENHRDAFLVLRSICKLSMRTLPDDSATTTSSSGSGSGGTMHSHIGLQTSASNDTWDGDRLLGSGSDRAAFAVGSSDTLGAHSSAGRSAAAAAAQLVSTGAIHPALESKLLALELILYVLQNTNFTVGFLQQSGPQFHAAIRNYLCVSLLKNCTSDSTHVVSLSLSIFVPVVRNFRTILKTEIEAFVTNVFFVILDSKNSPAEHKSIVVNTFNEICSDPSTLAEIFLNYDCDLSAVDLFHRIVNTLSRLSRSGLLDSNHRNASGGGGGGGSNTLSSFLLGGGGPTEAQMEKFRNESRELRLDAMRALRQILASLHASIVEPMVRGQQQQQRSDDSGGGDAAASENSTTTATKSDSVSPEAPLPTSETSPYKQNLVEIYGSKKKRRAEESEAILRFNQKPSAGIAYAAKCNHIDADDPADVARYLLKNKDELDKSMIGEYLGREVEYQNGFSMKVLHEYVRLMDFTDLVFDDAIRYFLSGFRLPGEAQKIDRIMEKFAERFTEQNKSVFPTADAAFILSFSIIMLNTDLHNPAIKEDRRMTREGFVRNNRGICDGQDLPEELLLSIFDRIKLNPISLKEDEDARERIGDRKQTVGGLPAALNPASFFSSHYNDMDRARETNFQKERDHIVRTTESLLKRRRHGGEMKSPARTKSNKAVRGASRFVLSGDSGLRDEYVSPMFEVTWGPALAAFSTAMESANGTVGALILIASDEELELAAENAAETIEVCLTGFRFAVGTAGLCGNSIARDAYMLALSRFSQLGTGVLLEPRHIRCVQTMLSLAREDGELLGGAWEHVFKALSEVNRFHQVFQLMARNDRAAAMAAERRRRVLEVMEKKREARERLKAAAEDGESIGDVNENLPSESDDDDDSLAQSDLFTDDENYIFDDHMDSKAVDESNAREVYEAVSEATIEAIYERSSSLSADAVKEFVIQLCLVSRSEISVGTNNRTGDINQVAYRQKHALLNSNSNAHAPGEQFHHTQPNIYNLQKLVEVTHYNMVSRPRLLFSEIWLTVADHLTDTALHSNPAIAMYAVDSFRQLSIQYLQRDELEVFEFQRRFLKPLETVMALSKQTSTKELLLNCVARLMHVFGTSSARNEAGSTRKGGLRSGWVPILTILGIGGRDDDLGIAKMSFSALSGEIELCLRQSKHLDVLLTEHFVETVNSLLMIVGGPHDDICIHAIDQLVVLTDALADGSIAPPQIKRKSAKPSTAEQPIDDDSKRQLEFWWPILLGLSRTMGDYRHDVRSKGLHALFGIINRHFFPTSTVADDSSTWENVQLIFRGVLNSVLDFADTSSDNEPTPDLPDDFGRTLADHTVERRSHDPQSHSNSSSWLETTFEAFMDACVDICLRSMKMSKDSVLVEEIFAILNSCLLSDSGALAVRGLRRLEQFVTSDLDTTYLTDDVWATVSHMLQRCLQVRNLPKMDSKTDIDGQSSEDKESAYSQDVAEFVAEDRLFSHRRFIGSNATMVVGFLLTSERFSIGLRWRLFLIKWLHRGVREWDAAAFILSTQDPRRIHVPKHFPDYGETSFYGRKWINRLLLQLSAINEIAMAPKDADPKVNRFMQGQKQIIELTEELLACFVQKEEVASSYKHSEIDELAYKRYTGLVHELLSGLGNMDDDHLKEMSWVSPVLLSSCIRSKNEDIRILVQKVVSRTSPSATSESNVAMVNGSPDDVEERQRL